MQAGLISRRGVLAGLAAAPVGALPVPAGDRLAFDVVRNGSKIGEHALSFARAGDALTVSVAVDITLYLGPICVFRYGHRAREDWLRDRIVRMESTTNDDGTPRRMTAQRGDGGLVVEGSKAPRYVAPDAALPGSHWNRAMLNGPFINSQDGRLMTPVVRLAGAETIATGLGPVVADHYTMTGDVDLDTYYDRTPVWQGLRFVARDGSQVVYRRMA